MLKITNLIHDVIIPFHGAKLRARSSGSLWWLDQRLLCISDMNLGISQGLTRKGGALLPPFSTHEALSKLADEINELSPKVVVCLGNSFDELKALDEINTSDYQRLTSLIAGREWIWIEGNLDAGPVDIGGAHMREYCLDGICFRHIAEADKIGEISGHFHPKIQLNDQPRSNLYPCFLHDSDRMILPKFGTDIDEMGHNQQVLKSLMKVDAQAVLLGSRMTSVSFI